MRQDERQEVDTPQPLATSVTAPTLSPKKQPPKAPAEDFLDAPTTEAPPAPTTASAKAKLKAPSHRPPLPPTQSRNSAGSFSTTAAKGHSPISHSPEGSNILQRASTGGSTVKRPLPVLPTNKAKLVPSPSVEQKRNSLEEVEIVDLGQSLETQPSIPAPEPFNQKSDRPSASTSEPLTGKSDQASAHVSPESFINKPPRSVATIGRRKGILATRSQNSSPALSTRSLHTQHPQTSQKPSVIKVDPVDRVIDSYKPLHQNLKQGLGSTPAVYFRSMGKIKAALKFIRDKLADIDTNTERFLKLKGLIPDLSYRMQPSALDNPQHSPKTTSSDDDHQSSPNQRSSGDSGLDSQEQEQSIISISPETPSTTAPIAPIKLHEIGANFASQGSQDRITHSNSAKLADADSLSVTPDSERLLPPPLPPKTRPEQIRQSLEPDTILSNNNQPAHLEGAQNLPVDEALIMPEDLQPQLTVLPLSDLFSPQIVNKIIAENDAEKLSVLIEPLHKLIFQLQELEGLFHDIASLKDPIKALREDYVAARDALINTLSLDAYPAQEAKKAILAEKTVVDGDCLEAVFLDPADFTDSSTRGRKILCHTIDGEVERGNDFGARAGYFDPVCGTYDKANPAENYLKPLTEKLAQNEYGLYNQDPNRLTHTPSAGIKVLHTRVNNTAQLKLDDHPHLKSKLKFYGEYDVIERFVQCGLLVNGDDFIVILSALSTFFFWRKALGDQGLIAELEQLEQIYRDDPEALNSLENWPKPLLAHSQMTPESQAKMLPRYFSVLRRQIPNYTPKRAITELPKVLFRISPYHFTALFVPNLWMDPSDLTGPNCKFCTAPKEQPDTKTRSAQAAQKPQESKWRRQQIPLNTPAEPKDQKAFLEEAKEFEHWLRVIDADQCLEFPIALTGGLHYCVNKCLPNAMAHQSKNRVDPQWRDEFLSLTPLEWHLKSLRLSYNQIYKKAEQLRAEEVWNEDVIYNQQAHHPEEQQEPSDQAANPRPKRTHDKPLALDIPLMMHPLRLPLMLKKRALCYEFLKNNPESTLDELLKNVAPEIWIIYKRRCHDLLAELEKDGDDNYPHHLLEIFSKITSKLPSYEVLFLNFEKDIFPVLKKHFPNGKYEADSTTLTVYQNLVKRLNKPEVPSEEHIKTLDQLKEECIIPELGISLAELLKGHDFPADEHNTHASLTMPEAIKLSIDRLEENLRPKTPEEILSTLDSLGTHFSGINFELPWLKPEQRGSLMIDAIRLAKPGAIKLLSRGFVDPNVTNEKGETGLHILLRHHQQFTQEQVEKTVAACLNISTCDPELLDANQYTPLMMLIANAEEYAVFYKANQNTSAFIERLISLMVQSKKVRLDQRSCFVRPGFKGEPQPGTALDLAIALNKPCAFMSLINQGAGDVVDVSAALAFAQKHADLPGMKDALDELKALCPRFDYEWALNLISTETPDALHPPECVIYGSNRPKRYLLKSVWEQLLVKKVDVKDNKQRRVLKNLCVKEPDESHPKECIVDISNNNKETRYLLKTEWDKLWSEEGNDPNPYFVKKIVPNNGNSVLRGTHVVIPAKLEGIELPVAFAKFYPEIVGFQEVVSKIHASFGSPGSIHAGAWNVISPNGKEIPLQLSNPVHGPSFDVILKDEKNFNAILNSLDRNKLHLLALLELLYGQEDGHAGQYKLRETLRYFFPVNVDSDHSFVPGFLPDDEGKILYIKVILFLFPQVLNEPLDPKTLDTLLFANGSKNTITPAKMRDLEKVVTEYAQTLFKDMGEIRSENRKDDQFTPETLQAIKEQLLKNVGEISDPLLSLHADTLLKGIETLLFVKGKYRKPTSETMERIKKLIGKNAQSITAKTLLDNANYLFDELANEIRVIDKGHMDLYRARGKTSSTVTGAELMADPSRVHSIIRDFQRKLEEAEKKQQNKTLSPEERLKNQSAIELLKGKVNNLFNKVLEIEENFSMIGVPLEKNTFAKFYERYRKLQKIILSGTNLTFLEIMKKLRPDLYREYNRVIKENPNATPYQLFKILTKGLYKETLGNDGEPVTQSSAYDVTRSQSISSKYSYQNTGTWSSVETPLQAYYEAKKEVKEMEPHAITAMDDISKLKDLVTDAQKEKFVNSIVWTSKSSKDSTIEWGKKSALDSAMIEAIVNESTQFTELKLHDCQVLTWSSLKKIIENSDAFLQKIDLSNCTGVDKNILAFLAEHCPSLETVILNRTTMPALDTMDCTKCPYIKHVVITNNIKVQSAGFKEPGFKVLDFGGCSSLETIDYIYSEEHALERPIEEERPLRKLGIVGCTKLKGEVITAILDRSPCLRFFIHGKNQPFSARSFGYFALEQKRFNRAIFHSMIQNGVLDLCGLPFKDKHLKQFLKWLKSENAPKVTEVNFRGCSLLTRLAMFEFVVRLESVTKVIYGGPIRHHRTCGGIFGQGWDMGLKNPITIIKALANGAIIAFSKREPVNDKNPGAVEYNIRMPDDKGKDHSNRNKAEKEFQAKHNQKPHTLPVGMDLVDCMPLPDGTVLLSIVSLTKPYSQLLILDPLTHQTQALEIPELSSLTGHLCLINPTCFVLHSACLYVVEKRELGWHPRYVVNAPHGGSSPVSNGKDLVAFSPRKDPYRRLCVMNTQSGELIYNHAFENETIKPLLFLDDQRLLFFNGEFYSVLNLSTLEIQALQKHKESEITDPKHAWASLTPTGELYVGGGAQFEVLDPQTFSRLSSRKGFKIEQFFIDLKGDIKYLQEGVVYHDPKRFFVMDLSFRQNSHEKYQCIRLMGGNKTLQIISPHTFSPNIYDIDARSGNAPWTIQMFSGVPTSTTLLDMLYGFFEAYCPLSYDNWHTVTCEGNTIQITGLSPQEYAQLGTLLNVFWKKMPALAFQHNKLSFYSQAPHQTSKKQVSMAELYDEDTPQEATTSELIY